MTDEEAERKATFDREVAQASAMPSAWCTRFVIQTDQHGRVRLTFGDQLLGQPAAFHMAVSMSRDAATGLAKLINDTLAQTEKPPEGRMN